MNPQTQYAQKVVLSSIYQERNLNLAKSEKVDPVWTRLRQDVHGSLEASISYFI